MGILDFIIGLTLMNAMPHLVLGVWNGRMFSAFGFGNSKNILYGLLNFAISITLFVYRHGNEPLGQNAIYVGAATILIIYFLTAKFWHHLFQEKFDEAQRAA